MKLRNKKTGEIGNLKPYGNDGMIWVWIGNMSEPEYRYNSLAELNEEWEDYEEPKEFYYIDPLGQVSKASVDNEPICYARAREFGNYFETKEQAEKAVEKLKAWKRLRDKGLQFAGVFSENVIDFEISDGGKKWNDKQIKEFEEDLQLLFGGEE